MSFYFVGLVNRMEKTAENRGAPRCTIGASSWPSFALTTWTYSKIQFKTSSASCNSIYAFINATKFPTV